MIKGISTKPVPVHYEDTVGWIADVEESLPIQALQAIAEFTYKVNYDRWLCMAPGDNKDRVGKALTELKKGRIVQRILSKANKEVTVFAAHEGTGKIISYGGK
jgi:hypothetical protein